MPHRYYRSTEWDGLGRIHIKNDKGEYPIRIIDFGEAFPHTAIPSHVNQPADVSAPELVFGEPFDYRIDLWLAGCMVSSRFYSFDKS
jgi:serine/threonine-protein kinase SRPK3